MLDSLINLYCGKNKQKREKVRLAFNSIDYNKDTKEYKVDSVTNPNRKYIVFWHDSAHEWFCECINGVYKPYKTYESLKKRLYGRVKYECCHIIACKIHKLINKE